MNDQVGLTIDPLDVHGFIRACQLCVGMSIKDQLKIGENARNKVLQYYTWKQHVQKIINYIANQ